jgi:hypothetical protein
MGEQVGGLRREEEEGGVGVGWGWGGRKERVGCGGR